MPNLPALKEYKQRRRFVRQLKSDDRVNYWPNEIFEEIVGMPDILNEKLADARASQVLARIRGRHVRNINTTA